MLMEIEKLKKYCEMFNAAWKLFKTYHAAESDEDRLRLMTAGELIYQKYPCALMRELIWCVFHEIERLHGEEG